MAGTLLSQFPGLTRDLLFDWRGKEILKRVQDDFYKTDNYSNLA